MINKKDLICDFKKNKEYCYLELRKSCAKCSLKVPYCCIDQSRATFKKTIIKKSLIPSAGNGVFVKTSNFIKKNQFMCCYNDLSSEKNDLSSVDSDYLVERELSNSKLLYDGSFCKLFNKGPLVNDIGFHHFMTSLNEAVLKKDSSMIESIFKYDIAKYNNINNAKLQCINKLLVLIATNNIESEEEIYISFGIHQYWFAKILQSLNTTVEKVGDNEIKKCFQEVIKINSDAKKWLNDA